MPALRRLPPRATDLVAHDGSRSNIALSQPVTAATLRKCEYGSTTGDDCRQPSYSPNVRCDRIRVTCKFPALAGIGTRTMPSQATSARVRHRVTLNDRNTIKTRLAAGRAFGYRLAGTSRAAEMYSDSLVRFWMNTLLLS
jgi:hypothetical protein